MSQLVCVRPQIDNIILEFGGITSEEEFVNDVFISALTVYRCRHKELCVRSWGTKDPIHLVSCINIIVSYHIVCVGGGGIERACTLRRDSNTEIDMMLIFHVIQW